MKSSGRRTADEIRCFGYGGSWKKHGRRPEGYGFGVEAVGGRKRDRDKRGFTLIELLVVIAIIALLMAILVPTLRRVRNQGRGVVCQSNLKQWGTCMAAFINENDGRFQDPYNRDLKSWDSRTGLCALGRGEVPKNMFHCPVAAKTDTSMDVSYGGTFRSWHKGLTASERLSYPYGSYGLSHYVGWRWTSPWVEPHWSTIDVRGRDGIPALLDAGYERVRYWDNSGPTPPECDAIPTVDARQEGWKNPACINRHDGGVNALFLDWSVRKVGLKELWTLKWQKEYVTTGQWTKAGGAEPQDWPQWMRNFKDY